MRRDLVHHHGRACPGHLRLHVRFNQDVDARHKAGHDGRSAPKIRTAYLASLRRPWLFHALSPVVILKLGFGRVERSGRVTKMKRSLHWLLPIVFVFLSATIALAEDSTTVVLGVGNRSCGSWMQARRSAGTLEDVYKGWIAGFLSGANSILSNSENHIDTLERARAETDAQGLWAWIDNCCQAHPLGSIAQASDALSAELIRRAAAFNRK